MKEETEPLIKPGGVIDIALASLVLLVMFGILVGIFLLVAFNYDPSAPTGPLPWSW